MSIYSYLYCLVNVKFAHHTTELWWCKVYMKLMNKFISISFIRTVPIIHPLLLACPVLVLNVKKIYLRRPALTQLVYQLLTCTQVTVSMLNMQQRRIFHTVKNKKWNRIIIFIIVRILQCLYKFPIKGKLQGNKRKS